MNLLINYPNDQYDAARDAFEVRDTDRHRAGWFVATCTAHYTPVAYGPFDSRDEAQDYARANAPDRGVFNPPPIQFVETHTLEQAVLAARILADQYKREPLP